MWTEASAADWEKGTAKGVAIGSDGVLAPGFELTQAAQLNAADVWAVASDKAGNAYLATGSPAQVIRIAPDGRQTVIFTTKDLSVQALAVGPDSAVYAAALPSAKVYKLNPNGVADETSAQVVFDPAVTAEKPKYIWAMQFDRSGRLLLGTGAPGAVYRLAAGAKPELVYASDEPHIRSLLIEPGGTLLAGSDGTGLVYRIGRDGKAFVIYEAAKREITSLALGPAGQIYVAAVGEKGKSSTLPALPVGGAQGGGTATVTVTVVQPGSTQTVSNNATVPDGSEVDLIPANPSEAPRRIWATHNEVVYALRDTPAGLLAATGYFGRVYRVQDDGRVEDVARAEASQVIGFADAPGRAVYAATANTGKLLRMSLQPAAAGTLTSEVYDASQPALWGRAEVAGANYGLETRTGNIDNPARGWSEWKAARPEDASIGQPGARFAQFRLTLKPEGRVSQVGINYLPANAAPVVDEILVAPGTRVNASANQPSLPQPAQLTFASQGGTVNIDNNSPQAPLSGIKDKTGITVRWAAHDDNGDDLRFALYTQGQGESAWRLLKADLADRYYSFDAALLPDGPYRIRVVATDAPSHPAGAGLQGEKVSDLFLVATATPSVALQAKAEGTDLHVTATATGTRTPIAHAEYSLDAAPWQYVEPVGRVSDAAREQYDFRIPAGPGPHTVTLRAYDRYDNTGSGKISVP